jgi:YHS domain-containing protein
MLAMKLLCMLALAAALATPNAMAQPAPRVSIKGYDTVAYFTESRPVKGSAEFRHDWDGTRYLFASQKNRDLFASDPDRYAPQFSGLCASGISYRKDLEADPTVWKIVDGRLYVFNAPAGLERLDKDPKLIERAHANWKSRER